MSGAQAPPRRTFHLPVFFGSLALVVACLAGFLFGVRLEAVHPASGTITAHELHECRALLPGLVEPGWYEGEVVPPNGQPLRVRLDAQGDGMTDPSAGPPQVVHHHGIVNGTNVWIVKPESVRFHRLQAGDHLWPGQVVAVIRGGELQFRLEQLDSRLRSWSGDGHPQDDLQRLREERDVLRRRLAQAVLRVPQTEKLWLVARVAVAPRQAVEEGDVIAALVPLDPETGRPRDLEVLLDVDEDDWGDVRPGQTVRVYSNVHNHRLHGTATARVERTEPLAEPGPNGQRRFRAVASVVEAPFELPLGSGCQVEIVVERKLVYRIILEH